MKGIDINIKYMQPPLGAQEVLTVGKQLQRKDYFYRCNDQPIASHCNSPLCRTRSLVLVLMVAHLYLVILQNRIVTHRYGFLM